MTNSYQMPKYLRPERYLLSLRLSRLVFALFLALTMMACGRVRQFSDGSPYAVELARVRSYYHAVKLESRLKKMDIPVYMVALSDPMDQSSKWYVLLTGAEKDTIAAAKLKVELDMSHRLKKLSVLNFESVKSYLLPLERKKIDEVENMAAAKPDLPENIYDLVDKFPKNDQFNVENVALYNFLNDAAAGRHDRSFYNAALDLPRGVSRSLVHQKAEAFAEVIYKDNLYGDRITVDVLKLKPDHGIDQLPRPRLTGNTGDDTAFEADGIAWYFAALILNTGVYMTEEYEKIQVDAYAALYGYKVVIEPRRDYLRTYMILVDVAGGFVIFSQSTDKTDQEILDYLAGFGLSEGMLDFSEFHNTFFTIPKCLEDGDVFLGYSSMVLTNQYARSKGYEDWSVAMVGHTASTSAFYSQKLRKVWTCSVFDLITPDKKNYIYNDMYRKKNYARRTEIQVNNSSGFFVDTYYDNELNFPTAGRHIIAVDGFNMSKEELLKRAVKFQTGAATPGQDPCKRENTANPSPEPGSESAIPPVETIPADPETEIPEADPEPEPNPNPGPNHGNNPSDCGQGKITAKFDVGAQNYLSFNVETELFRKKDYPALTLGKVYQLLLEQTVFVLPSVENMPVTNCQTVKMDLTVAKGNPTLIKLDPVHFTVTGYSLPGHWLHPCKFTRSIQLKGDKIVLITEGETTSSRAAVAEWKSSFFWRKADNRLKDAVKSLPDG